MGCWSVASSRDTVPCAELPFGEVLCERLRWHQLNCLRVVGTRWILHGSPMYCMCFGHDHGLGKCEAGVCGRLHPDHRDVWYLMCIIFRSYIKHLHEKFDRVCLLLIYCIIAMQCAQCNAHCACTRWHFTCSQITHNGDRSDDGRHLTTIRKRSEEWGCLMGLLAFISNRVMIYWLIDGRSLWPTMAAIEEWKVTEGIYAMQFRLQRVWEMRLRCSSPFLVTQFIWRE